MSEMLVNFNGQFIPQDVAQRPLTDTALLFGDSLFETLKAVGQRIMLVPEHLDRICLSAKLLEFPCDRQLIERSLAQMATALPHKYSRLRLTLSRGTTEGFSLPTGQDSWFALTAIATQPISNNDRATGTTCVIAPNRRTNPLSHLPQMKRGNHLDCLYAADFAKRNHAHEALFVEENRVIEGSSSNIFALYGEELHTPPLTNLILGGISRQEIIATAMKYGLRIKEEAHPLPKILQADEVWLTNSMTELFPVNSINHHQLNRGILWEKIYKLYQQRLETKSEA